MMGENEVSLKLHPIGGCGLSKPLLLLQPVDGLLQSVFLCGELIQLPGQGRLPGLHLLQLLLLLLLVVGLGLEPSAALGLKGLQL